MADSATVWIHRGLRVDDHPALAHAMQEFDRITAVYVWSEEIFGDWMPGAAQRWWIHEHLLLLGKKLADLGIALSITTKPLTEVVLEEGARPAAVFWNEPMTPAARRAARSLADALEKEGVDYSVFAADILHDPDTVRTQAGDPYRVFTPFYKRFLAGDPPMPPVNGPESGRGTGQGSRNQGTGSGGPESQEQRASEGAISGGNADRFDPAQLHDLGLVADHPWVDKLRRCWTPGEDAAAELLRTFLSESVSEYHDRRNTPAEQGTSRLSPYLAVGAISPRRIWHETVGAARDAGIARDHFPRSGSHAGTDTKGVASWLRELGWREFACHLLIHYPETPDKPLREEWSDFPWSMDEEAFERWKRGRTGYPIVDAGMRELWGSGWMHNRVRMIVASFLTKDLMIPWQAGARWFWDTLIDADLANNTLGWQWAAGSGADAQPFFRIFNPASQSRRHDPDGEYVRRWVEELRQASDADIHEPLDGDLFRAASGYPEPIVDHSEARQAALAAYESFKD